MQVDADAALAFAVDTARAAGDVILQHDGLRPLAQRGRAARMKGPRDPVTDADLASERLIVARLRERFPGTPSWPRRRRTTAPAPADLVRGPARTAR
jgi:3'-phosphoadenosine 5'-phosphosulfate (PAPS) 3'-phosphatase